VYNNHCIKKKKQVNLNLYFIQINIAVQRMNTHKYIDKYKVKIFITKQR
jgi:hypothetical protein